MAEGQFGKFVDSEEDWYDYVERFDQHCLAHNITDTPLLNQKRALFLSQVGSKTFKLMKSLLAPERPSTKTYAELCAIIGAHLCPKPLVIAERQKFYFKKQKTGESVSEFLAELRRLSETCEFGAFLNEALRDRLIMGLADRSARQRLLSTKDVTLNSAYDTALSFEMADNNLDIGQVEPQVVGKFSSQECFRCGKSNHSPDNCYFRKSRCHLCNKEGHIRAKCPRKKESVNKRKKEKKRRPKYEKQPSGVKTVEEKDETPSSETNDSEEDKAVEVMYIRGLKDKKSEIYVPVKINNEPLRMELDTGAAVSLMPLKLKTRLLPHLTIKESDMVLKTVTGEKVKVFGKCKVNVEYKGQTPKRLSLYIVDTKGPALFGRNWLSHIQLDWMEIGSIMNVCLEDEAKPKLEQVLKRYQTIFGKGLGKIQGVQAKLHLKPGVEPRFYKPRTVPFAIKGKIESELNRLENEGILERIQYSDWAAPIVPVRKANGEIRICGDYKVTVNQALQIPEHPMPKAEELFQALNGGRKFTKLDLSQAYQQVELDEASKKYVAINTHLGLFTYTRMPYGISAAPAIFQAIMDKLLHGINVGCYLDDIIITGRDDSEHLSNLEKVLARLQQANVRLRQDKCVFMVPSVTYLGFTINSEGVRMDTAGTEAVRRAPYPSNKAELQSFLGLVNHYRKHIPNMSTLCSPLNQLLRKEQKWCWNEETSNVVNRLKELLTSSDNVLVHYDPEKEVTLAVDASPVGLGAVLSQVTEKGEQPVAYASRSLTACERNYAQLEKEGLAIIFGVKRFHQYLYGRKFTLVTDNKPLSLILGPKKGIPVLAATRIQRWAMQLAAYDYDLKHKPATQNGHADALSRLPLPETEQKDEIIKWTAEATAINQEQLHCLPITAKTISKEVRKEATLSKVLYFTLNGWPEAEAISPELKPYYTRRNEISIEEGCLLWGTRTIVPTKWQAAMLSELHNNHPGMVRMKALARMHVWWPSMDIDIEQTVRRCCICQEMQPKAPQAEANPWKWPSRPWHRIHVDFAGPFMGENFLIVVDAHSKWPVVSHMRTTTTDQTIERLRSMFASYGLPIELVSDNGPQFVSDAFKVFLRNNNIRHILSAPYHPSTNGEAERFVQTFKKAMKTKKILNISWNHKIADFLLGYRNTPHSTTKRTPAELMFGRDLRTRLSTVHPNIGLRMEQSTSPGKSTRSLEVGERVLVRDYRDNREPWVRGVILKKLSPCSYSILVGTKIWKRHIDQLRAVDDPMATPTAHDPDEIPDEIPFWAPATDDVPEISSGNDARSMSTAQQSSPTLRPAQQSSPTLRPAQQRSPMQRPNGARQRLSSQSLPPTEEEVLPHKAKSPEKSQSIPADSTSPRKSKRERRPPERLRDYVQ